MRLLLAGASTRAAAESAARAGLAVSAIDAYADIDQHPSVRAFSARRESGGRVTPRALVRAAGGIEADAVAYLSPFENHPRAVRALARGRKLLGNDVDVLRRVRNPLVVYRELSARGFDVPRVVLSSRDPAIGAPVLLKPLSSGGGHGIRRCDPMQAPPPGWYLQELIDGWPGSVTFVAARGRCALLAVSRQLIGEAPFGASGYRYCGSLIVRPHAFSADDHRLWGRAQALATAAASAFDLVGVNGIDFIARDQVPVPIEINPRWSSSMELVDRLSSAPVMTSHVEACHGSLLAPIVADGGPAVVGKAIVFARTDVTMPDTRRWLSDASIRDVPSPGQRVRRGQPICTVFAHGSTTAECYDELVRCAAGLYQGL